MLLACFRHFALKLHKKIEQKFFEIFWEGVVKHQKLQFFFSGTHPSENVLKDRLDRLSLILGERDSWVHLLHSISNRVTFRYQNSKNLLKNIWDGDRPIPFENDLPVLVSHFYQLRDERKGRENARVGWRKKRGERILIQTESVYWILLNWYFSKVSQASRFINYVSNPSLKNRNTFFYHLFSLSLKMISCKVETVLSFHIYNDFH